MVAVLIVEPSRTFAEAVGLSLLAETEIEAVEYVDTPAVATARMMRERFDVVIVPVRLAHLVLAPTPESPRWAGPPFVVALSDGGDTDRAPQLLGAGASGWVGRHASIHELADVIVGVRRGETRVPAELLTRVVSELSRSTGDTAVRERVIGRLTPRESEVFHLLEQGMDRRQIATTLHVSPNTVRTHIQGILHRLGVHSILAAVAMAHPDEGRAPDLA